MRYLLEPHLTGTSRDEQENPGTDFRHSRDCTALPCPATDDEPAPGFLSIS
jgi:hypothetical protein